MKKTNKGFSMVELIIVIAIMAILAGALAPALIKYINKSRISTDIQTAQTMAQAITTALANEAAYDEVSGSTYSSSDADTLYTLGTNFSAEFKSTMGDSSASAAPNIKSKKDMKGSAYSSSKFYFDLDAVNNKVQIYVGTADSGHMAYPNVGSDLQ